MKGIVCERGIYMKKKIAVAMSGGIDSSFAAYLLLKEGYEVVGLNMNLPKLKGEREFEAPSMSNDLKNVCDFLNIAFEVIDYQKEFKNIIIKYFAKEYEDGRTPNPCVVCNKLIKFGLLLGKAKELGAEYLATGHYANIEFDNDKNLFFIKKALDLKKDQSYFLSFLDQEQLKYIKFPLGNYKKEDIRIIAKDIGLPVYQKDDSQEICFVPDDEYRVCLKNLGCEKGFKSGDMILSNGIKVSQHDGIANYTIGQRKGLGAHKQKMYVKDIIVDENIIVIGTNEELFSSKCIVENINWVDKNFLKKDEIKNTSARIRYKSLEKSAMVKYLSIDSAEVVFEESQRAISPGQAMVFYDGDRVVGGGWIKNVFK